MKRIMDTRGQMLEAVSTGIFLTLSGGFQDACTYYCKGGVYMAEHIRRIHKHARGLHWRQMVVAIEILLLFAVGFLPQAMNTGRPIS